MKSELTEKTLLLFSSQDNSDFKIVWELSEDRMSIERSGKIIWRGSLLPAFLFGSDGDNLQEGHCTSVERQENGNQTTWKVNLAWQSFAIGSINIVDRPKGFALEDLQLTWLGSPRPLHSLYFGASRLSSLQQETSGIHRRNWWPNWQSFGICVPSAKVSPVQSFFRSFDFGHCTIPLGSFGPSMGTPYAAAFPRPVLSAAMGNENSWICFGAGELPNAALSLKVEASNACMEWRYREDLWGAPPGFKRQWNAPMEISLGNTAWEAFKNYFDRFDSDNAVKSTEGLDYWGSWGEFKSCNYDLDTFSKHVSEKIEATIIGIDDGWETFNSSGIPHKNRFPRFKETLEEIRSRGQNISIWESLSWLDDLDQTELKDGDVLQSTKGVPIRVNWALDPRAEGPLHFCLDPSSKAGMHFLALRTASVVAEFRPEMLKLDFSYGLPGPDISAPRDPDLRGERAAFALLAAASQAAKKVDPNVLIYGHSIHPLWDSIADFTTLDDLGDCGSSEAAGHGQWSIWASLAGTRGMPINASSGYDWDADGEILLNSAIIGAPGANLPLDNLQNIPPCILLRRKALHRWYRKTSKWNPLWLNSDMGSMKGDPIPRCWGRIEDIGGVKSLTALALRDYEQINDPCSEMIKSLRWSGSWAIISQTNSDLFHSSETAIIPISPGTLNWPVPNFRAVAVYENGKQIPIHPDSEFLFNSVDHLKNPGLLGFLVGQQ